MATLEALAYGYTHITNAVFATDEWKVEVDLPCKRAKSTHQLSCRITASLGAMRGHALWRCRLIASV